MLVMPCWSDLHLDYRESYFTALCRIAIKQGGKTRGAHDEQSLKKNVFEASIDGYVFPNLANSNKLDKVPYRPGFKKHFPPNFF